VATRRFPSSADFSQTLALVIARANSVLRMRRSSGAYIVLRVHLEESDRLHRGRECRENARAKPQAIKDRNPRGFAFQTVATALHVVPNLNFTPRRPHVMANDPLKESLVGLKRGSGAKQRGVTSGVANSDALKLLMSSV
jgi:hypothetical protein